MSLLDKLPKLPFGNGAQSAEYFFSLVINFHTVIGSVWGIEGNKVHIISSAPAEYDSEDELIRAANIALDEALADFQPEPTKLLFGVPDVWLQDETIKPEYLKLLKQMVKELEVTPMAYVSTTHAICHLLQKQQGIPVTAVLVELSNPLIVTVVKSGKIIGSKAQKRSANLPDDIEKALLTFSNIEVLPSKIFVFSLSEDERIEKYKDELSAFSWMSQLPFLHLPKIELLEQRIALKAVCFAGGFELFPSVSPNIIDSFTSASDQKGKLNKKVEMEEEILPKKGSKDDNLEDLGFIEGDVSEQVMKTKEKMMDGDEDMDEEAEEVVEESFGQDEEYEEEPVPRRPQRRGAPYEETASDSSGSMIEKVQSTMLAPFRAMTKRGEGSREIGPVGPGVNLLSLFLNKFVLIPLFLILFFGVLFLFLPKARVTVLVDTETLENNAQIVADPTVTSVDQENKKIPGKIVETDITGSLDGDGTGKKQIGDPAKGTVFLYNKTTSSKSFPAGTVLVGPNNLTFKIDTSVTVASQSAVGDEGFTNGKASVSATATNIGPEGNLPSGEKLTIKDTSDSQFAAKVDQAFSGGVSKDVTVVTTQDQQKLVAALSSQLKEKAQNELQAKLTGDFKILQQAFSEQITKKSFSKNVGDQAAKETLTMTAHYKGTAFSESDLQSIAQKLVTTQAKEGYDIDMSSSQIQTDVSNIGKDGTLDIAAKFKATLKPKLDTNQMKKQIAGKTFDEAERKLKEIKNVISAKFEMNPSLPRPFQRLPLLSDNISIQVTSP